MRTYREDCDPRDTSRRMVLRLSPAALESLLRMVGPLLAEPLPADLRVYGMYFDLASDSLQIGVTSRAFGPVYDGSEAPARGLELRDRL